MRPDSLPILASRLLLLVILASSSSFASMPTIISALAHTQVTPSQSVSGLRGRAALDRNQNVQAYIDNMERLLNTTSVTDNQHSTEVSQQLMTRDFAQAARSLELEILRIERQEGVFSDALIEPLIMLGLAWHALEDDRRSSDSFTRAQHITHRHEGVLNLRQIPLVLFRTINLMEGGDWWQAEQLQRTGYRIMRHHFGVSHRRTILSATRLGTWLTLMGRYKPALTMYRRHLIELQQIHGGSHPSMAPLIRNMAITFLHEGLTVDRGITMQEQLVYLHEEYPHEFADNEKYASRMLLADLMMKNARESEAIEHYLEAWRFASDAQKQQQSSQLRIVRGPFRWAPEAGEDQLYFDFRFRVRDDGRPQYIKLMDTNATSGQSVAAIKLFRQSRFLPKISDGSTESVPRAVHRFTIDVDDSISDQLLIPLIDHLDVAMHDSLND